MGKTQCQIHSESVPTVNVPKNMMGDCCLSVSVDCDQPAVLSLHEVRCSRGLDPLLTSPGHDGAHTASKKHEGSDKVEDGLNQYHYRKKS